MQRREHATQRGTDGLSEMSHAATVPAGERAQPPRGVIASRCPWLRPAATIRRMQLVPDTSADVSDAAPRRRMTHEERRAAILTAARGEFSRSGFHGASTADIARAAGCSEPMLYKHFVSKQMLFAATLADVNRVMGESIDTILNVPGDPLDAWSAFLPVAMTSDLYAEMVAMRKLAVTVADEPAVCAELQRADARLQSRVRALVDRSIELGSMRPDVNAEYVAWTWLGLLLVASYRQSVEGRGGFAAMLPMAQQFIDSIRAT